MADDPEQAEDAFADCDPLRSRQENLSKKRQGNPSEICGKDAVYVMISESNRHFSFE
jgi:hypothetical protein